MHRQYAGRLFRERLFAPRLFRGSAVALPGDWPGVIVPRQDRTIVVPVQPRTITDPNMGEK